jgi:hypothetical protein
MKKFKIIIQAIDDKNLVVNTEGVSIEYKNGDPQEFEISEDFHDFLYDIDFKKFVEKRNNNISDTIKKKI